MIAGKYQGTTCKGSDFQMSDGQLYRDVYVYVHLKAEVKISTNIGNYHRESQSHNGNRVNYNLFATFDDDLGFTFWESSIPHECESDNFMKVIFEGNVFKTISTDKLTNLTETLYTVPSESEYDFLIIRGDE